MPKSCKLFAYDIVANYYQPIARKYFQGYIVSVDSVGDADMSIVCRVEKSRLAHWAIFASVLGGAFAANADAEPPLLGHETLVACKGASGDACLGSSEYFSKTPQMPGAHGKSMGVEGKPAIGLALAGGGTRASQFSIGVLKGLFESDALGEIDYLSTVSGGGYAGYWYMSQRMAGALPEDMFRDCIPDRYADTVIRLLGRKLTVCTATDLAGKTNCLCPAVPEGIADDGSDIRNNTNVLAENGNRHFVDPFKYQNNLRGHTDLFVPSFSYAETRSDKRFLSTAIPVVAAQLLTSSTFDLVGDTLFDWNLNASPSRDLYRKGIRRIYGLPPVDCAAYLINKVNAMDSSGFKTCIFSRPLADEEDAAKYLKASIPEAITFSKIRAMRREIKLPYWIINATTPVLNCPKADGKDGCVIREVFGTAAYPPHKATFEFTTDYWGAGEFGYWKTGDLLEPFGGGIRAADEAVASSAAFFDPNQRSFMLGGLVNGLLQISGFRWGNYIKNPHVSDGLRREHRMIPLFYVFHHWVENKNAIDIHLIDGGQSENLGAYTLIRRRVPNIILSDHASESESGNMEDICRLRTSLALPEFAQWNEGRIWHIHFDDLAELDKVCNVTVDPSQLPPTAPQVAQRYRYNVHAWTKPVLRGCAVEMVADGSAIDESRACADLEQDSKKAYAAADKTLRYLNLYLLKPALDLASYAAAQPDETLGAGRNATANIGSAVEIGGFLRTKGSVLDALDIVLFPNHSTINLTLDSSPWLFGAYRELGARAARHIQAKNGALVVDGEPSAEPMRPKLSYLINRESQGLTKQMLESFGHEKAR